MTASLPIVQQILWGYLISRSYNVIRMKYRKISRNMVFAVLRTQSISTPWNSLVTPNVYIGQNEPLIFLGDKLRD
jgi:hypothetical protein